MLHVLYTLKRQCTYKKYLIYRHLIKATVVLLPLLGLTWLIGIISVNNDTIAFAWIFTILNSLQVVVAQRFINAIMHECMNVHSITGSVYFAFSCAEEQRGL